MKPHRLISILPLDYFKSVFEDSPRKLRIAVLGVSGAKKKKKRKSLRSELASKEKEAERALKAAQARLSEQDLDQLSEEVIRNHLAKTPEMLIKFLDFMGVEHQGGYTEDMSFAERAEPEKVQEAVELLASEFPLEKVVLYLCYIELNGVTKVEKVRNLLVSWGWDPEQDEEDEEEEHGENDTSPEDIATESGSESASPQETEGPAEAPQDGNKDDQR